MSNSFYIILPSDTKNPPNNKSNKFRVYLPKTLRFESPWLCGLAAISYPRSYASIGTTEKQTIQAHFFTKTGHVLHVGENRHLIHAPPVHFHKQTYTNCEVLCKALNDAVDAHETKWLAEEVETTPAIKSRR